MSVSGTRDQRIAQVATLQRGRIARRQLQALGISASAISRRIANGRLRPLLRGVFAVGHAAPISWGAETAALLAVSGSPCLSHASAAAVWGLPVQAGQAGQDRTVHVLVAREGASARGVHVHRTRFLTDGDVRIHHLLPVTSPSRTLLDLAGRLTPRRLELVLDHALIYGLTQRRDIDELLGRANGRTGQRRLRELLDRERGPTVTRSEAEEHFLALVRAAQLPEPEINVRMHGWEIDFLWRGAALAVEIDGFRFHSTRARFERDRRKDAMLTERGLTVLRFTWRQLEREPLSVIARLSGLLARGG